MTGRALRSLFSNPHFSNLKSKAIKGAGINIVAQMILFIVHTLGVIILARLLKPQDFGLVTMVSAFSLLLMNFGVNGFTEFIIQKGIISHKEVSTIFWLQGFISLCLMLGFMAAAPIVAAFYREPSVKPVVRVMALGIMVQGLSTSHLALLNRSMEFSKIAVSQVAAGVISMTLAVVMALTGWGHWAVVARQLSIPVVMAIGAWIMCPWRPGFPGQLKSVFDSLKYTLHVYGNFTLGYFARNFDKILLGRYYGPQILGAYDRAYYLSTMPAEQLVTPLHSVALATLSRLRDDHEKYLNYYTKALSMLAFIGVFASLILTLSGKDLIYVLLGSGWEQAGYVVMAFGPGIGIMFIYATHSWLHLSLGKPERWLRWSLVSFGLSAAFILISAPFGAVAVAAAYSISFYVLLFPALYYAGLPIGLKVIPLGKAIGPYFGSALSTWLIWLAFSNVFIVTSDALVELNVVLRLSLVISLSTIIYVALVVAFHRSFGPLKELLSLMRTIVLREKSGGE